jgi:hypothetical protein
LITTHNHYLGTTRYLLAIGNDFIAKFYRLSINDHEIFLRELGIAVGLSKN